MIYLRVFGYPVTQGSKRAILPRGALERWKADPSKYPRPVVIEDRGVKHKDWRSAVASVAQTWREENPGTLLEGPIAVRLAFTFVRSASQKREMPYGEGTGDGDKLVRAVFDSLTGKLWRTDAQVVAHLATKTWGDPPGVEIEVDERLESRWATWALS